MNSYKRLQYLRIRCLTCTRESESMYAHGTRALENRNFGVNKTRIGALENFVPPSTKCSTAPLNLVYEYVYAHVSVFLIACRYFFFFLHRRQMSASRGIEIDLRMPLFVRREEYIFGYTDESRGTCRTLVLVP